MNSTLGSVVPLAMFLLEITKLCSKGGGVLLIMIINSLNNAQVGGFHNWFHFYMLEAEGQIDYRGFMEHVRIKYF